jgi:hypothetical protein
MFRTATLVALFLTCGAGIAFAQSPPASGNTPVCVYHDRTYSEGAAICPQARFMLTCSSEQGKLVWRTVTDQSLSRLCLAPTVSADRVRHRTSSQVQRIARTISPPTPDPSAKCFAFNGKRYCE